MKRISVSAVALVAMQISYGQSAMFDPSWSRLPVEIPSVVGFSTKLGHTDPHKVVNFTVSLPYGNPHGAQVYADRVSDPENPDYRQFLTPQQVGEHFGLSPARIQAVANYLSTKGIKVDLVSQNRLSVLAHGTVAQVEAAFKTTVNNYKALDPKAPGNVSYYSFSTPLQFPTDLAKSVIDVSGLESFRKPKPRALTASQGRVLYNLAPAYDAGYRGQNRTVAISNFDGYRLTNVPIYYTAMGLPTPPGGVGSNITEVKIGGGSGAGTPFGEGDLDIQMALGMAPLCSLYIYDGVDLLSCLAKEANDNKADVISESYGWNLSNGAAEAAHNTHVSMTIQGITYMVASGDNGTLLEPFAYPDYDPDVLQVGGTVAIVGGAGVRISETGWNGSGGGWMLEDVSFNTRPSWQKGIGVPNINFRLVPDVAGNSFGATGAYQFVLDGAMSAGDGTSFASPVFAGQLGVAEQKLMALGGLPPINGKRRFGRIMNVFYAQNGRSDVWFDITTGQNGMLPDGTLSVCTPKWDFVTGWGAINFDKFIASQVGQGAIGKTVAPSSVSIVQGTYVSGNLSNIVTGGGTGYRVRTIFIPDVGYSTMDQVTFPTGLGPGKINNFTTTFKVSGASGVTITGQIYLWNVLTSKWDMITALTVPLNGTTVDVSSTISTGLNRYVTSAGMIKAGIRELSPIGRRGPPGAAFTGALRFGKLVYFPN